MLTEIAIGVVGGQDVDEWREIAMSALQRLQHMLHYELQTSEQQGGVTLTIWDYRLDAPDVISDGTLADRSLAMVDRSEGLIAILGNRLPPITKKEIWRAFEKLRKKLPQRIWIFFDPSEKPKEVKEFLSEIEAVFNVEPRYAACTDPLDFQARIFTTLIPYLLEHPAGPLQPQLGDER